MANLVIDLKKLRYNIDYVLDFCREKGVDDIIGIIKGCYAHLPITRTFLENGIKNLGISTLFDAVHLTSHIHSRPFLITVPVPREAEGVVLYCKSSVNSEINTIKALADACDRNHMEHEIILMVDTGDLREGLMPEDVLKTVREIMEIRSRYLKFQGLGSNLGCCSGTLPDDENMKILHELAIMIESGIGCEVKTVSVGGSVILDWMEHHELPSRINQLRIGEIILLGYNTSVNKKHRDLFDDVMIVKGEIVEIKEKPSVPSGIQGCDAFGKTPEFPARGIRRRAIINFGSVDTGHSGIIPRMKGLEIINSNSNYTIVDITECKEQIKIGDFIDFNLNYSGMMRIFLSPYTRAVITAYEHPALKFQVM